MASGSGQDRTVEKLRSLFHLLDPENSSLSKADKENHEDLWEVIVQCSRRVSDYYHKSHPMGIKCNFNSIIPRFMQLLRESVLSHQWPEALKLVKTLSSEAKGTDNAVWKVGLACLYQDKEKNSRLVEQFVKQVYVLKSVTVVEVLLEYLLFLLTQSNTKDAQSLVQICESLWRSTKNKNQSTKDVYKTVLPFYLTIQNTSTVKELKQNPMHPNQLKNEKRSMAQTLFFAYQGLALYVEWKLAIFRTDHELNETEAISRMLSQGSAGRAAKTIADDAIEYLITLKDTPGVWDIFITRLIEMYEYYGNTEDSREILMSYRDRSPNNPNAHRYLYEFECNHDGEEAVLIQCLQGIIKIDPCNSLCLTLFSLTEKNDPSAVSLLFDYLDYPHRSGHEEAWDILAKKLRNIDSPDVEEVVRKCWDVRRDWWPGTILKYSDPVYHPTEQSQSSTMSRSMKLARKALLRLDKSFIGEKRTRDVSEHETDLEPKGKRRKTRPETPKSD